MITTAELSENSHQGFEGLKAALCLASMDAKSNNASGLRGCLRRKGTGSRCSGKERDETGLDYFGARYLSSALGRFLSVDEGPLREEDPQSLNRYAYVRNNPLSLIDEDGNYWVEAANKNNTFFNVTRENVSLKGFGGYVGQLGYLKYLDYKARDNRGDTNHPSLIPFRGFVFDEDTLANFEDPQRYSLREGVLLDQKVFSAFSEVFGISEQKNLTGTLSTLTLDTQQLQDFYDFHTAFRYVEEIEELEDKMGKEGDPQEREKLTNKIKQRKSSEEYKKYGTTIINTALGKREVEHEEEK